MSKLKTFYICQEGGCKSLKWLGKCPECGNFNTFVEEVEVENKKNSILSDETNKVASIVDIKTIDNDRVKTEIGELDRVLGGGIVQGSLILIGGDPGIGKSTLLLQSFNNISKNGINVLYVSGEESAEQTKIRANRLGINSKSLYIFHETNIDIFFFFAMLRKSAAHSLT